MTVVPLTFEKLGRQGSTSSTLLMTRDKLEAIRNEALESGRNMATEQFQTVETARKSQVLAALDRAATDLVFTHVEARQDVLASLAPLLTEVFSKVLPKAAQLSLPALITDQVRKISETIEGGPVRIKCASDLVETLSETLARDFPELDLQVVVDPAFLPGQCRIVGPELELQADLPMILAEFSSALSMFFDDIIQEANHA